MNFQYIVLELQSIVVKIDLVDLNTIECKPWIQDIYKTEISVKIEWKIAYFWTSM